MKTPEARERALLGILGKSHPGGGSTWAPAHFLGNSAWLKVGLIPSSSVTGCRNPRASASWSRSVSRVGCTHDVTSFQVWNQGLALDFWSGFEL